MKKKNKINSDQSYEQLGLNIGNKQNFKQNKNELNKE